MGRVWKDPSHVGKGKGGVSIEIKILQCTMISKDLSCLLGLELDSKNMALVDQLVDFDNCHTFQFDQRNFAATSHAVTTCILQVPELSKLR